MRALKGYCFYNGGLDSGSSKPHRHIQVLPYNDDVPQWVVKQTEEALKNSPQEDKLNYKLIKLPFFKRYKHFVCELPTKPTPDTLGGWKIIAEIYNERYQKIMVMLGNENHQSSYNLIWTLDWMLVMLRSKEHLFDKHSVNSMGVLGSLMIEQDEDFNSFTDTKVTQLLDEIFSLSE